MIIRAILDAYDVTESTTFLQLASCHADFKNNRLVVSTMKDISDTDWAEVLRVFAIDLDADYEFDAAIIDGVHFIKLDFG